MHITVTQGRQTSEVFTSTTLDKASGVRAIVGELRLRGFTVESGEFELTNCAFVRVVGLRSDKAVAYASDIVRKAGRKAGFVLPVSTQYR